MNASSPEADGLRFSPIAFLCNSYWRKCLCLAVTVCALVALPVMAAAQACISTGAQWKSVSIGTPQAGKFTTTFSATPSAAKINAVVGLSQGAANGFANLAANIRFNSTGHIDARHGDRYAATSVVPYSAGVTYFFELDVNVPAHTYSVFVTSPGGSKIILGTNFAFRK